jgi:actin related protein 2/3 complex, subunit 2
MLILLEKGNRILHEAAYSTFKRILVGDENTEEKQETLPMEVKFCDYDGTRLRALISPDDLTVLKVSLYIPCWKDLESHDVAGHLKNVYGDFVGSVEADFNFTLSINLKSLPADYSALATKISLLKFHALGAPFTKYFKALAGGKAIPSGKLRLTEDTCIYFSSKNDRVVVVFSLNFKEKFDEVLARVFLTAMSDVKKTEKSLGPAPAISYDLSVPPNEMKQDFGIVNPEGNCGFLSFAILPRHVATQDKIDLASDLLQTFRNYLSYHIKCAKTYFHSQMRKRVKELLQVLNRAKSADEETKKNKTASGRTFERKV